MTNPVYNFIVDKGRDTDDTPATDRQVALTELFSKVDKKAEFNFNPFSDHLAGYNVFCNRDGFKKDIDMLGVEIESARRTSKTILDISNPTYGIDEYESIDLLSVMLADYITCSDEMLQEAIYADTGKLATIVPNVDLIKSIKKPKFTSTEQPLPALWYGSKLDLFSIHKYKTQHFEDQWLNVVFDDNLPEHEVVLLPETNSEEGERRRFNKAKESLFRGKYVIAPGIYFNMAEEGQFLTESFFEDFWSLREDPKQLEDIVKEAQKSFKKAYKLDNIATKWLNNKEVVDSSVDPFALLM
jgi:hypothetical protein